MIADKAVTQSNIDQCRGLTKPTLLMMTTHHTWVITVMYFDTVATTCSTFTMPASIYTYAATIIST